MSAPSITPPPSKAAERMREYRARIKCGLKIYPTALDEDGVGRLVEFGFLLPEDINNRRAVGEALSEWFDTTAYRKIQRDI
jgi:hypothetical protein